MEHTKGKWEIQGGTNGKGDLYIWKAGEYYGGHAIATVHGEIQEGAKGNANLIAAAPDLLEACEGMYELLCRIDNGVWFNDTATFAGKLAIAKTKE